MPGKSLSVESMVTTTGYVETPLDTELARLMFVTFPLKCSPSKASAVTSTFCPIWIFVMSVSSMDISKV